jgi:hypothetical protein
MVQFAFVIVHSGKALSLTPGPPPAGRGRRAVRLLEKTATELAEQLNSNQKSCDGEILSLGEGRGEGEI